MESAIFKLVGPHFIDVFARSVANGDHGPGAQKAYLWLQGKKTPAGVVLAMIAVALLVTGNLASSAYVATAAYLLIRIGVVDSRWRTVPAGFEGTSFARFLKKWSAPITSLLAVLALRYSNCDPAMAERLAHIHVGEYHLTCHVLWCVVVVLGGEFAWAFGSALITDAPKGDGFVLQVLQSPVGEK